MIDGRGGGAVEVRPLSARSIVLSLLLATHPPEMAPAQLDALGEVFEVPESTLRAALTRLVGAGELERSDGLYRIGGRLQERQRRQDAALAPPYRSWDGTWETVVVVAPSRSAADRGAWRQEMERLRLAELREGVWTRPANLERPLPDWSTDLAVTAASRPTDVRQLVARLWDLDAWASTGDDLLAALAEDRSPVDRLAVAAALVRHLRTDPALPPSLRPVGWNAPALAAAYDEYQRELAGRSTASGRADRDV
jgi:phenylacetic acid degradation operon negative regulatory protein